MKNAFWRLKIAFFFFNFHTSSMESVLRREKTAFQCKKKPQSCDRKTVFLRKNPYFCEKNSLFRRKNVHSRDKKLYFNVNEIRSFKLRNKEIRSAIKNFVSE